MRLQEQPFRILELLLERPGQLVSRDEIRRKLWPDDTFVGFDAALNTAVRKLRDALNDSAENPRFLETVPRQGYRFIAPVSWLPEKPAVAPIPSRVSGFRYLGLVATLILVGVGIGIFWHLRRYASTRITAEDTIVLADFLNKTGDATFDDSLNTALRITLRQSPFFKVLSSSEVARTLQRMARPAGTQLTPDVARELCQRAGSKAYLVGSIRTIGTKYVLELKSVDCRSGDELAEEQSTAVSKEDVLDALGKAASRLRRELGESLASVQKFDLPLARATTPSFEALKQYSLALKAYTEKGPSAALPYGQHAIDLDPNFAVAYRAVGMDYSGLGQIDRAKEYYSKAFQLRDHVAGWEKLAINADYYLNVTGELDKAAEAYEQLIASYPRNDGPYSTLGIIYAMQGQYEKASDITTQALRIASSFGSYGNLAIYKLALQRFDEARRVIQEAKAREIDGFEFRSALYGLAFIESDSAAMAEQQAWFARRPEENIGLALASDTEAYRGYLRKARELTGRAVESAIRAENKESGPISLATAALREAAFGNADEARQAVAKALKLAPASQGTEIEAALALGMAGDAARAESLARDLSRRFPLDTQMQSLWLPAIQTQLALVRKKTAYILNAPQSMSLVEYGAILFDTNASCLYPTSVASQLAR
jgi:tetratricopeptide (TPR) repeat protein